MSTGNQIFVFDMGKSVKIDTLARRMIELAGFEPDKDIKIEYTGLRPGEKLYEEVLSDKENTIPTSHERILVAKVREYDYSTACGVCGVPAVAVPGGGHPLGRAADEAHRAGVQVQKLPLRAVRPPNRTGAAGRRAAAVLTRSF